MTVGTNQRLSGHREAFPVNLMADTVPGPAEVNAVPGGNTLKVPVIIRIHEVGLEHVVVDIAHKKPLSGSLVFHRLKLQICHRSVASCVRVLIDPETYLFAWYHFPGNEMLPDNFLGKIECHLVIPEF